MALVVAVVWFAVPEAGAGLLLAGAAVSNRPVPPHPARVIERTRARCVAALGPERHAAAEDAGRTLDGAALARLFAGFGR